MNRVALVAYKEIFSGKKIGSDNHYKRVQITINRSETTESGNGAIDHRAWQKNNLILGE